MATDRIILRKIKRIVAGKAPRVLDLFAGCGGLSLGFQRAGFSIAGAVESDPIAARTHAENFFRDLRGERRTHHARALDITRTGPAEFVRHIGAGDRPEDAFDLIVGGPPCQAFARVGRAKLREIDAHPTAYKLDARGNLYLRYMHYLKVLRPVAMLMENVPDVLNYGGHNIPEEMCETLEALGYECRYTLLNAVHYGVPEMRERMFLLAIHRTAKAEPVFPTSTNAYQLPRGYEGSRQVALKNVRPDLFEAECHYVASPDTGTRQLPRAVTAHEAIGDLPPITAHLEGLMRRGTRRFTELAPYFRDSDFSTFASAMRHWPGYEGNGGVLDHVIRSLPRDYAIFRRMNWGDQYPEAFRHALAMLEETISSTAANGHKISKGSERYRALMKQIVPPYDPGKFPNKWRKMAPNEPARTLMAHLGKDSYSHIHYDSDQARTISVREAARLQSFPDGFVFSGTMNPAFRQIGNAVPPFLAYRLALSMRESLGIAR